MKAPNRYLATLLAASAVALAAPLAVQADPGGWGPGGGRCEGHAGFDRGGRGGEMGMFGGGFGPRYLRGLNLTEEQRDQVFKLMHAQAPTVHAKMKELREARGNLEALTRAPNYDEAKVRALTDKAAGAMAELARIHARGEHDIYQMLSPEQRQQLNERQARHDEMDPGRMQRGPGYGMRQG